VPREFRPALTRLLWLGVAGFGGATLFAQLGRVHWFFDLFTHFPLQMTAGLTVLLLAAFCLRRWRAVLLTAVFLGPNLLALSYYFPTRSFPDGPADLRVVCFNVLTSNSTPEPVRDYLTTSEADVIFLMETNRNWLAVLAPLEKTHPHVLKAPRDDNFGMALYSRYPIESHRFLRFEGSGVPGLQAIITIDGKSIEVVCGHPIPPIGAFRAASRNAYLEALAELAAASDLPTIVLGDFNATIWSPFFRDFLEATTLEDTGRKGGFQATWRRGHPLFSIPIDHILHSDELSCVGRQIGPALGSDHRAVMADFAFE